MRQINRNKESEHQTQKFSFFETFFSVRIETGRESRSKPKMQFFSFSGIEIFNFSFWIFLRLWIVIDDRWYFWIARESFLECMKITFFVLHRQLPPSSMLIYDHSISHGGKQLVTVPSSSTSGLRRDAVRNTWEGIFKRKRRPTQVAFIYVEACVGSANMFKLHFAAFDPSTWNGLLSKVGRFCFFCRCCEFPRQFQCCAVRKSVGETGNLVGSIFKWVVRRYPS